MTEKKNKTNIKHKAHEAIHAESAPPHKQKHRALLFRITLIVFVFGFALLTFLVKTTPSFVIDLRVTQAIQMINHPAFDLLMKAVSWPGFAPQSILITLFIGLLMYFVELRWEGVMTLIAYLI